jgi:hypothetical protein
MALCHVNLQGKYDFSNTAANDFLFDIERYFRLKLHNFNSSQSKLCKRLSISMYKLNLTFFPQESIFNQQILTKVRFYFKEMQTFKKAFLKYFEQFLKMG